MNVILINESSGKAWVRSRRVLSKFLPQIGSRAWLGHISVEGLADLKEALKKSGVSKLTSICCHRIVTRTRTTVEWTLGSTKDFDEIGRYSFRQTATKPVVEYIPTTATENLLLATLRLSGLAHDLAKANVAYANKLYKGTGAEALRHDLLSFILLADSLCTADVTDEVFLAKLATDPASMCSAVSKDRLIPLENKWLKSALLRREKELDSMVSDSALKALEQQAPVLMSVLWLVLSHHRLPLGIDSGSQLDAGRHVNKGSDKYKVGSIEDCLTVANGTPPWEDANWLSAVSTTAKKALEAMAEMKLKNLTAPDHFWVTTAVHHLRPLLILGDHLASKMAVKSVRKNSIEAKKHIFANTIDSEWYGDSLTTHLLKVPRYSRQLMFALRKPMPITELPYGSKASTRTVIAQFQWQLVMEDACKKSRGPTFVSMVAETGSGKTLAGLRAINALSKGAVRATLALGLRTLTSQSAQAYLEDGQVPANDLIIAVGQPETLGLVDIALENAAGKSGAQNTSKREVAERADTEERATPVFGSESAAGTDLEADIVETNPDTSWTEGLCTSAEAEELWGRKNLKLISSPIVVCTIDHLVSAVTIDKGGDAKLHLRLATSDLIIDEVDSFSSVALQTLGKLAFCAGLYGRHVIIQSATMSPAVQNGIYAAWQQGVEAYCARMEHPLKYTSIFASNVEPPVVLDSPSKDAAVTAWEQFVENVAKKYADSAKDTPRRNLAMLGLPYGKRYSVIRAGMAKLHEDNHTVDAATGARVSTGFLRCNTTKSARKLAKLFLEKQGEPGSPLFVVQAYHSKFPRKHLAVLDATLGVLMNRKVEGEFLRHPRLQEILKANPGRDVVVVVCTTTLIETGRDFDFDWAILEPRSARGEVQAIGRVRRHRYGAWNKVNVLELDKNFNAWEFPELLRIWAHPGIEDEMGKNIVSATLITEPGTRGSPGKPKPLVATDLVLPIKQWLVAFDAQVCILPVRSYAENRIGYLEQHYQSLNLSDARPWKTKGKPSLCNYLRSYAPLNNEHAVKTPFRSVRSQILFIPKADAVYYWDSEARIERLASEVHIESGLDTTNALIPDLEEQALALDTESPHVRGCALPCKPGLAAMQKLSWHPLLGFLEG